LVIRQRQPLANIPPATQCVPG